MGVPSEIRPGIGGTTALQKPAFRHRCTLATCFAAVALAAGCGSGGGLDVEELERVEDLSEALANDLHDLSQSIRTGDLDAATAFFAEHVGISPFVRDSPAATFRTGESEAELPPADSPLESLGKAAAAERLQDILADGGRSEDVRLKVKHAEFSKDGAHGKADIKFFAIRRGEAGQRRWVRGTGKLEASRGADGPWKIESLRLKSLNTVTAQREWFSEVSDPAGLTVEFPKFGEGANKGFVSHGVAVADVNDDGLPDIAATGVTENYLYLNDPSGRFRDVSAASLVKFSPTGSGALFLDYDNDGDKDLFFASTAEQVLLENRWIPDGVVRFVDVSNTAGVAKAAQGFSVVSADIDGNGYPDIYVCSYNRYGDVMPNSWVQATNGTPNLLFLNNGDGTFREAAEAWGVADGRWSYAAQFFDIDSDGDQDLYVANDFGENALYVNTGSRFEERAAEAGLVDPGFGMGVSFGDYDNDGDFDLHVTNMSSTAGMRILSLLYPEDAEIRQRLEKQAEGNSLYENLGDGTFRNVTEAIGGLSGGWAFGGGFIDIDLDGREDLYSPNGFVSGESMKDT